MREDGTLVVIGFFAPTVSLVLLAAELRYTPNASDTVDGFDVRTGGGGAR